MSLVNIAEIKIAEAPMVLSCVGLGSCVAVALYVPELKLGGLAHVLLPDSHLAKEPTNLAKFADTAVDMMVNKILAKGVTKKGIKAKIFGGANMFSSINKSAVMNVGERNVKAVQAALKQHAIPIVVKDVGGHQGRSVFFELDSGRVTVKMFKTAEEKVY